jgi:putative nucleotidyltransferase with HDIG domain
MAVDAPQRRTATSIRRRWTSAKRAPRPFLVRWRPALWAAAYVVVTTLCYAPTLSFRDAPVRAGEVATRDVVAPRDLIVPDPAATARRKTEAAAEVLPVYDWDAGAPGRLEGELRRSFREARDASRGKATSAAVRDAFDLPIGDEALSALERLGFAESLEDSLVDAGLALYSRGVVDNRELLLEIGDRGVVQRDSASHRETRRRNLADIVEYGSEAKSALSARLDGGPLRGNERSEVAAFLAASLRPNLTYNAAETAARREAASRSVESVFTQIPRGKVIVRRGDEISPRAAEWIAAVRESVSDPSSWVRLAGIFVMQSFAAAVFWLDARRHRRRRRERTTEMLYGSVLATGILFALLTRGAFALAQSLSSSFEGATWAAHTYYAIPFAAGPIIASLVAGMGPALLFAAIHSVDAGILMGQSFTFIVFALIGSLGGIFGLGRLRSRSVLLAMGGIVAAANLVTISMLRLLNAERPGWEFGADALGGLAGGWFVAMLVGVFLPVFEHVFHVTTDIRLLELSNQNLPLLRNLALAAPGTYQHSLMLGHMAEAAAEAIGADALLARVSGYYHDIGKTRMPDYFIENQPKGANRHDKLEPSMSALVIAAHVKEGVEMAKRARLPEPIVAAIREHHGTKRIQYFYQKALTKAGTTPQGVREEDYRHAGPKPSTRVIGILMIADAVEAASRTLIDPTPAKIRTMIRTIVDDCLRDGQFDECDLTMRDLAIVAESLERTVSTMYHHRIDYPGFEFNRDRARRRTGETSPVADTAARPAGPRAV